MVLYSASAMHALIVMYWRFQITLKIFNRTQIINNETWVAEKILCSCKIHLQTEWRVALLRCHYKYCNCNVSTAHFRKSQSVFLLYVINSLFYVIQSEEWITKNTHLEWIIRMNVICVSIKTIKWLIYPSWWPRHNFWYCYRKPHSHN